MTQSQPVTPYSLMGGEPAILSLVDRFYFYMDTLPEASEVRSLHQTDLSSAKSKLFKFLSGWLGGPDLFAQEYGHPRLKQRHFPFKVTEQGSKEWMLCMNKALYEVAMPDELRKNIKQALQDLATHMINTD
jgi:hemoglobin